MVWLGNASGDSDVVMDFVSMISKAFSGLEGSLPVTERILLQALDIGSGSPHWEALGELLARSQFHRLWMIQKLTLSRKIYAICGGRSLEWESVTKMIEGLY